MLELDLTTQRGHQRFRRHADAVTQAEIRRLSRLEDVPADQAHDAIEAVQQELRRLAAPRGRRPRRPAGSR